MRPQTSWWIQPLVQDYDIQISKNFDFAADVLEKTSTNNYFSGFMPPTLGDYYWRVRARYKNKFGPWSETRKLSIEKPERFRKVVGDEDE